MYFPLLRARQFELISIRELVSHRSIQGRVFPVLEPVKGSTSNLNLANAALVENQHQAFLILNPIVGEAAGDIELFSSYLSSLEHSGFQPAFYYKNNDRFIRSMIAKYGFHNCMLICYSGYVEDLNLRRLCEHPQISHIMVFEPHKNRNLDRHLKRLEKIYIRLDDVFEKQEKNAHFLDIPAHKFTEEHLYYQEDGYQGFSDFTVLSSEYTEGGSTPRAVVIHLTYLNTQEQREIWIRHFTSETNDSIANVQGKFAEAATKAIEFCNRQNLNNVAIQELRDYFEMRKYPGLGIVKKISIKNHLLVISNYLT